ncbi:MAG: ABC transporter permease [Clostridia bacterium]|nr:ABC transporter permease [Clostridia bacterium]
MKRFWVYAVLQLKRGTRQIPRVALFTLILLLTAGVLCTVLLQENEGKEENSMLTIGVTGDTDNVYIRLGLLAVREFDPSSTYVNFQAMSMEEAHEKMSEGKIAAYLEVPYGFMDAIFRGEEVQLIYVSHRSPVGLGALLSNEVVRTASDLVSETMAGIFATQVTAREEGLVSSEEWDDLVENINIRYVDFVMERDTLHQIEYVGVVNGLSFGGYYVCGILFLLILLMGITMAPMMVRSDCSMVRLANTRGIGIGKQVVSEFFGFSLPSVLVILVIALSGVAVCSFVEMPVSELDGIGIDFAFRMIPAVLMLAAWQMLLYEFCSGVVAGVLLQFVLALGLSYISGCFYPPYFFPEILQTVASWLPGGIAIRYIGGVLNGSGEGLPALAACCVLLLAACCGVRALRMRREAR